MKSKIALGILCVLFMREAGAFYVATAPVTTHEAALILVHKGKMPPNTFKTVLMDCMRTQGKVVVCRELKLGVKGKL